MRKSDGAVILSKQKIKESSTSTIYEIDLMASKPGRGFYELKVTVTPSKSTSNLDFIGNEGAILLVKVLGSITLENVGIGVADADQSSATKLTSLTFPQKLKKQLIADHHHKLILKFGITDQTSSNNVRVHQAFVKLAMKTSEIIYVAEPDNAGVYKFDLDVSGKAKEFGSNSGTYAIYLLIGDAVISNPLNWHLADVKFEFPGKTFLKIIL